MIIVPKTPTPRLQKSPPAYVRTGSFPQLAQAKKAIIPFQRQAVIRGAAQVVSAKAVTTNSSVNTRVTFSQLNARFQSPQVMQTEKVKRLMENFTFGARVRVKPLQNVPIIGKIFEMSIGDRADRTGAYQPYAEVGLKFSTRDVVTSIFPFLNNNVLVDKLYRAAGAGTAFFLGDKGRIASFIAGGTALKVGAAFPLNNISQNVMSVAALGTNITAMALSPESLLHPVRTFQKRLPQVVNEAIQRNKDIDIFTQFETRDSYNRVIRTRYSYTDKSVRLAFGIPSNRFSNYDISGTEIEVSAGVKARKIYKIEKKTAEGKKTEYILEIGDGQLIRLGKNSGAVINSMSHNLQHVNGLPAGVKEADILSWDDINRATLFSATLAIHRDQTTRLKNSIKTKPLGDTFLKIIDKI